MEVEELTIGHRPPNQPARRRLVMIVVGAVIIGLLVGAATFAGSIGRTEPGLLAPKSPNLQLVLLGDSSAGKESCSDWCVTYTDQLATNLQQEAQKRVTIEDRSWRSNTWPPASVDSVLAYLRMDPGLREAVRSADVVVIALSDRDMSRASAHFTEQLDTFLFEVSQVRQNRPLVLHLIVGPWPRTSDHAGQQAARAGCQVARSHHGECVNLSDLVQRDLLTPADWVLVAGHPWLSQHGHDVVARELIAANGRLNLSTSGDE